MTVPGKPLKEGAQEASRSDARTTSRAPHSLSKAEPRQLTEETQFGHLCPWPNSFGHSPKLLTAGGGWNIEQLVNPLLCLLASPQPSDTTLPLRLTPHQSSCPSHTPFCRSLVNETLRYLNSLSLGSKHVTLFKFICSNYLSFLWCYKSHRSGWEPIGLMWPWLQAEAKSSWALQSLNVFGLQKKEEIKHHLHTGGAFRPGIKPKRFYPLNHWATS